MSGLLSSTSRFAALLHNSDSDSDADVDHEQLNDENETNARVLSSILPPPSTITVTANSSSSSSVPPPDSLSDDWNEVTGNRSKLKNQARRRKMLKERALVQPKHLIQQQQKLRNPFFRFTLYADVMREILSYLSVKQLAVFAQLSKQWHHAIKTVRPLGRSIRLLGMSDTSPPSDSVVARHVSHVENWFSLSPNLYCQPIWLSTGCRLPNLEQLPTLFDVLRQSKQQEREIVLPTTLTSFSANVEIPFLHSVLDALTRVPSLTELVLTIRSSIDPPPSQQILPADLYKMFTQTDFTPLLRMLKLSNLQLNYEVTEVVASEDPITKCIPPSLVSCLRSMPSLKQLALYESHGVIRQRVVEFIRLIAQQDVKLERLRFFSHNTEPILRALALIPSITEIPGHIRIPSNSFKDIFAQLPNLRTLQLGELHPPEPYDTVNAQSVLDAISCCPKLEALDLTNVIGLDNQMLSRILSRTPNLTSLRLTRCPELTTLSAFLDHGLPQRLVQLALKRCDRIPTPEYELLFGLKALSNLTILETFKDLTLQQQLELVFKSSTCRFQNRPPNAKTKIEIKSSTAH